MSIRRAGQTLIRLLYGSARECRRRHISLVFLITILSVGVVGITAGWAAGWRSLGEKASTQSLNTSSPLTKRSHLTTRAIRDISSVSVTSVSAASFENTPIAPDSIVAAFGVQLATQTVLGSDTDPNTPGIQLPTDLAGTTVEVNGRLAGLFFVSSGQVNFAVPGATELGTANVVIKSGDGTVSNGTVAISQVAPAIFAANANGKGVPAATIVRVKTNGSQLYEPVSQFNQAIGRYVTKPIDMGPDGEQIFLVLFLSGIRKTDDPNGDGNFAENLRVLIGGNEVVPSFAGRQPDFVGLDQVNVEIPRSLIGRGIINVSVSATGFTSSNLVDLEIAGIAGSSPPQVSGFGAASALAGQTLVINGNGFSSTPADNLVRISNVEAQVMAASPTQLTVMVPFGVESGTVSVRTTMGEGVSANVLPVRTSISGFVEDTSRQPMGSVSVKVSGTAITATTNEDGAFVLPDVPVGSQFVEVDGSSLPTDPPYPVVTLKIVAQSNRDNQFSRPIALQQATGSGGTIGGGGGGSAQQGEASYLDSLATISIQTGDFRLELPDNVKALFPNGSTSGTIYLTPLQNGRTPVDLPFGFYSSSIVQITPFNVKLDPGGKLILPNKDGFPAGAPAVLFRYDQTAGQFVPEPVRAAVSADGQRIETDAGAIKVTSYYFASVSRQTTTITGRVLESDGKTTVSRALVRFRGQEATTDGNGSYVLRYVPVRSGESVSVEVSYTRSNSRVDKAVSANVPAIIGGITKVPDVLLPGERDNRPPTILATTRIEIDEGKTSDYKIVVSDPDAGQRVDVKVEGARFASIVRGVSTSTTAYLLRLAPGFSDSGEYTLTITATDSAGAGAKQDVAVVVKNVNRPPVVRDISISLDEDTSVGVKLEATDPDGDRLSYTIVTGAANGTLTGDVPMLVYTPKLNFNGSDQFTFKVSDGNVSSNTATVSITIRPVNDPPVLNAPATVVLNEGQPLVFAVSATDVDAGDVLTISTIEALPFGATLIPTGPGSLQFSWIPNSLQSGSYKFTFRVTDSGSPSLTTTKESLITIVDAMHDLAKEPSPFTVFGAAGRLQTLGDDGDTLGTSVAAGDLNGDGIPDLAIGAPGSNANGIDSGQVFVIFGKKGLEGTIDLARQIPDIVYTGEAAGDRFGASVAIGDINGDGKKDLIVGAPFVDVDNFPDAGTVYVVFGLDSGVTDIKRAAGLTIYGDQRGDRFGTSLAAGFIHTKAGPAADLIVGAPGRETTTVDNSQLIDAGCVYGFFGSKNLQGSIPAAGNNNFIVSGNSTGSEFGTTLALGDFNGDGYADFATGAPSFSNGAAAKSIGAVYLISGAEKLDAVPAITLVGTDDGDRFGAALAMGDFNNDGKDDLIIGAPGGDGPGNLMPNVGEVYVIYGGANQQGRPADLTIYGATSNNDEFPDAIGTSLAVGDFTGDGIADLAIGAPGVDSIDIKRKPSGAVFVIFGIAKGITGAFELSEKTADTIVYGVDAGDNLGNGGLAIADINGSGIGDLIMGIPSASSFLNSRLGAGEVRAFWGTKR